MTTMMIIRWRGGKAVVVIELKGALIDDIMPLSSSSASVTST